MLASVLTLTTGLAHAASKVVTSSGQFDLACAIGPDQTSLHRSTFHVDVTARRWCSDECAALSELTVTDRALTFVRKHEQTSEGGNHREDLTVDRLTGHMSWVNSVAQANGMGHPTEWEGSCRTQPFTGQSHRLF